MKSEKGGALAVIIIIVVLILLIIVSAGGGGNSGSSYNQKQTLQNAYDKSKNGETLTEREKRELDSYREWERKNYGNNL